MRSTGLAIVLIRSRELSIGTKSVTLNDLERRNGPILHYFTEFVYDVVVKQLLGLPRF